MSSDGGIQQGCVTLTLHRGESLVGLNPDGTSNPFVTASIGHQTHVTPVVKGTTNPLFETTITFTACPLPTILTLKVYNKAHASGAEELLGSTTLTLFSASPMTRRTVHLSHGGNVLLSQKARDGCGSLDISYAVVVVAPHEVAQFQQNSIANHDLPAFLRDDSSSITLTSAYSALKSQPTAFPPPPTTSVPQAPMTSVPQPPTTSVPQPPTTSVLQPPTTSALQPPMTSVPQSPMTSVPQPPTTSVPQPPTTSVLQPPTTSALQPPMTSVPQSPMTSVPQPPTTSVPQPPMTAAAQKLQFGPIRQPSFTLESCAAPPVLHHGFQAASGLFGSVATSPLTPNTNKCTVSVKTGALDSTPPAPVPPTQQQQQQHQQLSTKPHFSLAHMSEPSMTSAFLNDSHFGLAKAPVASVGQSPVAIETFVRNVPSANEAGNMQPAGGVSGSVVEGVGLLQGMGALQSQLTVPQPAFSTRGTRTPPSSESTLTTNSNSTPSSTHVGKEISKFHQRQPVNEANLIHAAAATTTSTTTTATPTTAVGKGEERPKKKVTILAVPGDASANAAVGQSAVRTMTPLERAPRHGAPSPAKDIRRSSSGNGRRSSSRGRAPSTTTTAGVHRPVSQGLAVYQRPEELLAAAAEGNLIMFQKLREEDPLLSRGFDNVRDYSGRTILHIAAWHGHTAVLKTLLQPSPAVPMLELRALRSHNGNTILHSAANGGCIDTVQWLRFGHAATGTLLGMRNTLGVTATDCAREAGFAEIAALLDETV